MSATDTQSYDIAIIGGGMVGASLALGLVSAAREYGLTILVCESQSLPESALEQFTPSYDARSTALSYGSRYLYEQLGIWERIAEGAQAIDQIQVSDKGHFGSVRLEASQENVPALGYVVENRWMGQMLLESIQAADDVITLLDNAEVVATHNQSKSKLLDIETLKGLQSIEAKLVVIADGGRSGLRESLGIDYQQNDYDQYAVITNLSLSEDHCATAYERFTAEGPMALLPLPDDENGKPRAALVWTFPLNQVDEVMGWSDDVFLENVQLCFGYRAGAFTHVGERYCYPLKLSRVKELVRPNLVVLGNAAHTLHPIAGQGFNLALRGAMALAENILNTVKAEEEIGSLRALQAFEKDSDWDRDKTILFSDKLMKLFSNPRVDSALARNLGLLMMELSPTLKHHFARSAMGLDVPASQVRSLL